MAKELKLKSLGLAGLCDYYGLPSSEEYKLLKEKFQRGDCWRRRPLLEPMIQYSRRDGKTIQVKLH